MKPNKCKFDGCNQQVSTHGNSSGVCRKHQDRKNYYENIEKKRESARDRYYKKRETNKKKALDRYYEQHEKRKEQSLQRYHKNQAAYNGRHLARNKAKNYPKPSAARILVLDIETSPITSYTWGTWQQNVAPNQIKQDWFIMSWAAKFAGEKKVYQADQRNSKVLQNDKKILQKLWKLMDEADIVLGQNSQSFDVKKINARFIEHGMRPPSPYRQIDTLRLARKLFAFTSNKLEHLSNKLNEDSTRKSEHSKFPGFKLWDECLKGNKAAWTEMAKYNIQDVIATEALYLKLAPWAAPVNFSTFAEVTTCSCGSRDFRKDGFQYTNAAKYRNYRCLKCGKHHKGERV